MRRARAFQRSCHQEDLRGPIRRVLAHSSSDGVARTSSNVRSAAGQSPHHLPELIVSWRQLVRGCLSRQSLIHSPLVVRWHFLHSYCLTVSLTRSDIFVEMRMSHMGSLHDGQLGGSTSTSSSCGTTLSSCRNVAAIVVPFELNTTTWREFRRLVQMPSVRAIPCEAGS